MRLIDVSTKTYPNTFCKVDDADYDFLMRWKWHARRMGTAALYVGRGTKTKPRKIILMHRVVCRTPKGKLTDHVNMDGLDNRRKNLRVCGRSGNAANILKYKNPKSSKYKGVYWSKTNSRWQAQIHRKGKTTYLGQFFVEADAAKAYDAAARKFFGEFANTNFYQEKKK